MKLEKWSLSHYSQNMKIQQSVLFLCAPVQTEDLIHIRLILSGNIGEYLVKLSTLPGEDIQILPGIRIGECLEKVWQFATG